MSEPAPTTNKQSRRPWLQSLRRRLLALCIVLASFELFSFIGISILLRRVATPRTLFNSYFAKLAENEPCKWGDYVSPHPYHALYYPHRSHGCTHPNINQFGLAGEQIPAQKSNDHYTVLVLGGSVAEQLAP